MNRKLLVRLMIAFISGLKPAEVILPSLGDNGLTMWSVDVTPEMCESVMKGQPMFMKHEKVGLEKTRLCIRKQKRCSSHAAANI